MYYFFRTSVPKNIYRLLMTKKGKISLEMSRNNDREEPYIGNNLQHQRHSLNFILENNQDFSYRNSISITKFHGLQHYCSLGQANLYRVCGLWKRQRPIWLIFFVQKRFQIFEYKTQFFQEG